MLATQDKDQKPLASAFTLHRDMSRAWKAGTKGFLHSGAGTEVSPAEQGTQNPTQTIDWIGSGQGHWSSSADQSRSATGGIESAKAHKQVSKLAPVTRKAGGCNRPYWVFTEGASGRSGCA